MTVEEYYGMVMAVLMGLTFIAFLLIFYYIIYGEKEESATSLKMASYNRILVLFNSFRFLSSPSF